MGDQPTQRRLVAVLIADIAGYTRLMEQDADGTVAAWQTARQEVIKPTIADHSGKIVKLTGDGFLVEFQTVQDAVNCAVDMQDGLAAGPLDFRMGINLGDIIDNGEDIHGEGLNIAARIEALAEPGGICISRSVFVQVRNRLDHHFEDMGKHKVKHVSAPVRVYAIRHQGEPPSVQVEPPSVQVTTLPLALPDKPSIVVLPFDDMSADTGNPYFADGLTEDIITELSRFSSLFVIGRKSAFTYKGKNVKAQEIGRDLGVHYFVEGSVRRAANWVRVTVQLIDSETGNHIWADRYDREMVSIFDLQDELVQAIVATLPGRLQLAEENRIHRKPPKEMAVYDYVIAGRVHHHRVTSEDNSEALRLLELAIQLDPDFPDAYAWKACTLHQAIEFGFRDDHTEMDKEADAMIEKALSLDKNDVECHRLLCEVHMERRRHDQAETHSDLALEMNPNDPRIVAQRGELLTWLGRPEEGVEWIEKAMRVDPFGAPGRAHLLERALYSARRYAEAIDAFKKIISPTYIHLAEVAACHARIGDQDGATKQAKATLKANPDFTVDQYMQTRTYKDPADAAHLAEGLRTAFQPA